MVAVRTRAGCQKHFTQQQKLCSTGLNDASDLNKHHGQLRAQSTMTLILCPPRTGRKAEGAKAEADEAVIDAATTV